MDLYFVRSQSEAKERVSFWFHPAEPLSWIAGQSIKIELAGPYGPLEHRFSIASAPHEGEVMITTRLSGSTYKNSLAALQPGDAVKGYGIEGDFVWGEGDSRRLFVAAGIGITPFHSILKQRVYDHALLAVDLIYASR